MLREELGRGGGGGGDGRRNEVGGDRWSFARDEAAPAAACRCARASGSSRRRRARPRPTRRPRPRCSARDGPFGMPRQRVGRSSTSCKGRAQPEWTTQVTKGRRQTSTAPPRSSAPAGEGFRAHVRHARRSYPDSTRAGARAAAYPRRCQPPRHMCDASTRNERLRLAAGVAALRWPSALALAAAAAAAPAQAVAAQSLLVAAELAQAVAVWSLLVAGKVLATTPQLSNGSVPYAERRPQSSLVARCCWIRLLRPARWPSCESRIDAPAT